MCVSIFKVGSIIGSNTLFRVLIVCKKKNSCLNLLRAIYSPGLEHIRLLKNGQDPLTLRVSQRTYTKSKSLKYINLTTHDIPTKKTKTK